jgi:hypothetical protein
MAEDVGTWGPWVYGAGAGVGAFAELAQGIIGQRRERRIANYNAQITERNARAAAQAAELEALQYERARAIAEQDALLTEQAGAYREARMREQSERLLSETRAIVASSGLLMEGSPLRVYEESARAQERDILAERYATQLQARALREQGVQAGYAATLSRYGAQERLRVGAGQAAAMRGMVDTTQVLAGLTRAGATLTGGAAQMESLRQRQKEQTLLSPRRYAYTRATTAQQPFVWWNSQS